jgi:methylthioribose-1-phosphate isomerase
METYFTIKWDNGVVRMIDQRYLPQEIIYNDYRDYHEVSDAIKSMVIRGAPAIGAAAGFGMALAVVNNKSTDVDSLHEDTKQAAEVLRAARPTASNLSWAIDRILNKISDPALDQVSIIKDVVVQEALAIADEDARTNRQMGLNALPLIPDEAKFIHHCNTGSLATVDYGTALGVIRAAHEHGKKIHVYVDETRPRLQGARLTSWELKQLGIPHTVIVDGASGHIMRTVGIDLCVVGCDRIVANGDVANKIGTYNLAMAAHIHKVPFYVVGPTTTIDMSTKNGDDIPIEERPPEEITHVGDTQITPDGIDVGNYAFDVTPAKFITAIITERGVVYPPYEQNLADLMGN